MRKVAADKIEPNMVLARDVAATSGNVLLGKGTVLNPAMGRRLKNWGIYFVYVEGDEESHEEQAAVEISTDDVKKQLAEKFSAVIDNPVMRKVFDAVVKYKVTKGKQQGNAVNKPGDLLSQVKNISTIPTIPTVLEKITLLLQNPQTSAEEIGRAITTDQSLSSKVLRLVNSAFYGFPGKISTINHAVVILGFETIKNIVLTASIFDAFRKKGRKIAGFDMEKFWLHSIACGAASQATAKLIGSSDREEFFIAGLIHDMGKIILCQYMPKEFAQVVEETHKKNQLFYESEKSLFGTSHQEIGGVLCESWNLPLSLQNAVRYHHAPSKSRSHYMPAAIVHVADVLVRALDLGNGGDNKIPAIDPQVWESLGLENMSLQPLLETIGDEVEKADIFMQI